MKKPRTTARAFTDAARHLARAAKELSRAAKLYQEDNRDLTARVLTPGGTRLDRETRLGQAEKLLTEQVTDDVEGSLRESLLAAINLIQTVRREDRE